MAEPQKLDSRLVALLPRRSLQRTFKCEKCGGFLAHVELSEISPGAKAEFLIEMRCRNRKCKHHNSITVGATRDYVENKDEKQKPS